MFFLFFFREKCEGKFYYVLMRVAFLYGKEMRSGGNLPLSEQRKRRAGRHVFGELVARVSKTGNRSCWHMRHVRGKRVGFNHQAKMH